MKRTFGGVLSVLILVACVRAADPGMVLHKRVSEVRLTLVATDRAGRPWPGLSAANLIVSDQGHPVSDFQLRSADDTPLRVGIMLDLSDSTQRSWLVVRAALTESMDGLLRPGDEVQMMTFNSQIRMERVVTGPLELREVLPSSSGGLTALYDSLYEACEDPLFSGGLEPRRSALILFSDGEDNLSYRGLSETIAFAERAGIAIYTIAMHKPTLWLRGDAVLRQIARDTGGRDFVVKDPKELRAALQIIHEELRTSYLIYYRPPSTEERNGFHRVKIFPAQDHGLQLRTRAGYYIAP